MILLLFFIGCVIWIFVSPRCVTCPHRARVLGRCVPGALLALSLVVLVLFG